MNPELSVSTTIRLVYDGILALWPGCAGSSVLRTAISLPCLLPASWPQHSCRMASWKAIRGPCSLLSLLSSQSSWWGGFSGGGGRIWQAPTSPASASGFWSAHQPCGRMRWAVLLSITSKYVLRVKGRHLWNPSNFGICVMLVLAADDGSEPEHSMGQLSAADD